MAGCLVLAADLRAAEPARPHILFAFADDWGRFAKAYAASEGGDSLQALVPTPNFDKVARAGVLFQNAFVNAPSCTPCRSSLLSGQYFWRTGRGAILQGARWDSDIPAWPLLLQENGYHIGKTWKVWSPGSPADAPIGGQKHAYQRAGNRFNQFSQQATRLIADGQSVEEARRQLLDEVRGNFRAFLQDRGEDQPFCYWFGPTNVHRKWIRGSGKKLWGINPDSLKGRMPAFLPDVPTVREDLADYFGEIAAFDAALGVLIEELRQAGQLQNTLIAVSGDHGPPGFPHGKCNLYDFGTRVALAIAGPSVEGGRVVDDLVSLPDLAPTFLEAAREPVPDVMTARSLWPTLRSEKQGLVDPERTQVFIGRERHVARAREGLLPYPQRAIRTADHLFIINFRPDRYPLGDPYRLDEESGRLDEESGRLDEESGRPEGEKEPTFDELANNTFATLPDEDAGPTKAWLVQHRNDPQWKPTFDHAYGKRPREELFDLRKDPDQMRNVADDPEYAQVVERLRKQLLDELRTSGDPRLVEDGKFFETPPLAGPLPDDSRPPRPRRRRQ